VDKNLRDGGEQEDTWAGEGAEALARNLLVDGETGESFPAQVNAASVTCFSAPYTLRLTKLEVSHKLSLKDGCVHGMDLKVFWLGVYSQSDWAAKGGGHEQQTQKCQALAIDRAEKTKCLASSCLS
jgi:hypothetical protein